MKQPLTSLEWITKLVSFDTTSRNSNLDLIASLQNYFNAEDLPNRLIQDPKLPKANIFATLPAANGSIEGGYILSGHTDVVPIDGQTWDTDPFCATLVQDRLYGRGTADMKSFIGIALALIPELKQIKLAKPLHFAFSYDEEVGCHGAALLVQDLVKQGIKFEGCIVGEPTEMRPVVAHKGIHLFRCRTQGKAAHSSLTPEGCNAIEYAAELICRIRKFANRLRKEGPFDQAYDVPFNSLSTNLIQGGNAFNTIPAFCEFFFEFRNLANTQTETILAPLKSYINEELLPEMRREYPNAAIELDALAAVPSFEAEEKASITALVRHLRQEKQSYKVAYATEAGIFQQAEIPTILCGPGSIEQAHRANEFISLEEISRCEAFLRELAKSISE